MLWKYLPANGDQPIQATHDRNWLYTDHFTAKSGKTNCRKTHDLVLLRLAPSPWYMESPLNFLQPTGMGVYVVWCHL